MGIALTANSVLILQMVARLLGSFGQGIGIVLLFAARG